LKIPVKRKLGSIIAAIIFVIVSALYIVKEYDHIFDFEPDSFATVSGNCNVHFIDVGQGDSSLIVCDGVSVLIDGGENSKGDEVLLKLSELKIESLDYVIGTHAHSDHIGGLDTVINSINVKNVILYDLPEKMIPTTKTYTDLLDAVLNNNVNVISAEAGKVIDIGQGKLFILAPLSESYDDHNDFSIVTRFEYGSTSFLFTGDAEEKVEMDLIESGVSLKSTLLKVGHHGSDTSCCEQFLNEVKPEIAVIEVGKGNSYKHPHSETLSKLNEIGAKVYRTDLDGDILAVSDGKSITITCENGD